MEMHEINTALRSSNAMLRRALSWLSGIRTVIKAPALSSRNLGLTMADLWSVSAKCTHQVITNLVLAGMGDSTTSISAVQSQSAVELYGSPPEP